MEANLQAPTHGGTFRPWAPIGRSWRRLRRRPRGMQLRTVLIVVAIVVGLIAWLVLAPSGTPGGGGSAGAAVPALTASTSSSSSTPVSQASTSDRGVSKTSINVVFPVVAVNSLAGKLGFAEDKEYNEQIPAINLFVDQINQAGGINGRKINPIIVQFDPTNDANMQALCEQWTQGTPPSLPWSTASGPGRATTSCA